MSPQTIKPHAKLPKCQKGSQKELICPLSRGPNLLNMLSARPKIWVPSTPANEQSPLGMDSSGNPDIPCPKAPLSCPGMFKICFPWFQLSKLPEACGLVCSYLLVWNSFPPHTLVFWLWADLPAHHNSVFSFYKTGIMSKWQTWEGLAPRIFSKHWMERTQALKSIHKCC